MEPSTRIRPTEALPSMHFILFSFVLAAGKANEKSDYLVTPRGPRVKRAIILRSIYADLDDRKDLVSDSSPYRNRRMSITPNCRPCESHRTWPLIHSFEWPLSCIHSLWFNSLILKSSSYDSAYMASLPFHFLSSKLPWILPAVVAPVSYTAWPAGTASFPDIQALV